MNEKPKKTGTLLKSAEAKRSKPMSEGINAWVLRVRSIGFSIIIHIIERLFYCSDIFVLLLLLLLLLLHNIIFLLLQLFLLLFLLLLVAISA